MPGTLKCQESVTDIDPLALRQPGGACLEPGVMRSHVPGFFGGRLQQFDRELYCAWRRGAQRALTTVPRALCMANTLSYLEVNVSRHSRANPCPLGSRGQLQGSSCSRCPRSKEYNSNCSHGVGRWKDGAPGTFIPANGHQDLSSQILNTVLLSIAV